MTVIISTQVNAENTKERDKTQTTSRNKALSALCKIGLRETWSDDRIHDT